LSDHKFPYRWNLSDGYPAKGIDHHGMKVFGTFVCGGGSTMGYKLAGYDHLGGVEIDKKMAEVYQLNHKPKHFYLEDIRLFNQRTDLPDELYNLDLLDGSPPCSSFSMAGNREKDWGKQKKFREGQADQVLDDLVFEYVKTIEKLKPKVALLENVKGLITGNAKVYAKKIHQKFTEAGYNVQLFLLNAASMGVPQKRERVFFIGLREDIDLKPLELKFYEMAILFKELSDRKGKSLTPYELSLWNKKEKNDRSLACIKAREGKESLFSHRFLKDSEVMPTIDGNSKSKNLLFELPLKLSENEITLGGSFPLDFNFNKTNNCYLIGMSVPPVMTAQISHQIYLQWLSKNL